MIRAVLDPSALRIFGTARGVGLGETIAEICDEPGTVVAAPIVAVVEAGAAGRIAANGRIEVVAFTPGHLPRVDDVYRVFDLTLGQACALDLAMAHNAYLFTADPDAYATLAGGDTIHEV